MRAYLSLTWAMRQIGTRKQPAKTHLAPKVNRKALEFSTFLRRFPLSIFKFVHLFPLSMNKLLITLKNPRHFPFSIHILLKVVENYCLTLIKPALCGFKAVKIVKMSVNNPESLKRSNMMETTVDQINPVADDCSEGPSTESVSADYSFVTAVARIALYDDLRSAPRVTEIQPAETGAYIDGLAAQVYEQARQSGGTIPYTVVREVSENFIHARFKEIIVSILDHGNTIRFADQGPGISFKDKAQLPGFSSAIEPMKSYIRGVGSGLPIVKEYLEFSHGTISIEDNMGSGSVVTISVDPDRVKAGGGRGSPVRREGRRDRVPTIPGGRGGRIADRCLGRSAFRGLCGCGCLPDDHTPGRTLARHRAACGALCAGGLRWRADGGLPGSGHAPAKLRNERLSERSPGIPNHPPAASRRKPRLRSARIRRRGLRLGRVRRLRGGASSNLHRGSLAKGARFPSHPPSRRSARRDRTLEVNRRADVEHVRRTEKTRGSGPG